MILSVCRFLTLNHATFNNLFVRKRIKTFKLLSSIAAYDSDVYSFHISLSNCRKKKLKKPQIKDMEKKTSVIIAESTSKATKVAFVVS
jgi:hypothetical protein